MNPRRSRSVKLVPARATNKALEVEIAEEDPRMSSSAANTLYCCIARDRKVVYCYNSNAGDPRTEATAALCLEHAPPHHRHYVATSGSTSYAFLMADDHVFFAIIDPSVGKAGALQFLERVRDAFRGSNSSGRNGFHESLVPAMQRLAAALEKMPRAAFSLEDSADSGGSNDGRASSKVPLLGRAGSRKEKKKSSSSAVNGMPSDEQHGARGVRIDVPPEEAAGAMSLERSASQASRLRRQQQQQQPSRWMRHVKVIIVIDAVVCLALFAAWLAVCKGFQCVSG